MVIKKPWYRLHSLFINQKCTKISFEFEKICFFVFGGSICSVRFSWTSWPETDAARKRLPNCFHVTLKIIDCQSNLIVFHMCVSVCVVHSLEFTKSQFAYGLMSNKCTTTSIIFAFGNEYLRVQHGRINRKQLWAIRKLMEICAFLILARIHLNL